jgi:hypothetical protein
MDSNMSGGESAARARYAAINVTADDSDGVWRLPEGGADWIGVTKAEYDANNWRADATDGWRTTSKTYGAPYDQWEPSGEPSGWDPGEPDPSGYRSTKVFEPPFTEFEPAITQSTPNQTILARLIAGNDNGVPAIWNGTQYTNPEVADLYISPNWSQFDDALRAVALGECGGTLTLQTKLTDGSPAPVEFQYQRSTDGRVVKTTPQVKAATFDFSIPSGQSITVDVLPTNLSETVAYQNGSWTCRAGPDDRPVVAVPNAGGPLSGVQVSVGANEAVSCTLTVS